MYVENMCRCTECITMRYFGKAAFAPAHFPHIWNLIYLAIKTMFESFSCFIRRMNSMEQSQCVCLRMQWFYVIYRIMLLIYVRNAIHTHAQPNRTYRMRKTYKIMRSTEESMENQPFISQYGKYSRWISKQIWYAICPPYLIIKTLRIFLWHLHMHIAKKVNINFWME